MPASAELVPLSAREFRGFQELILAETGICLKDSKRSLVESRLARRLRSLDFKSYGDYLRHVTSEPVESLERREMVNCITTNKTDFFRENHHFQFLRDTVIPELRARAAAGAPKRLRIWSAACSTGEEPYSIAITIREALGTDHSWDVKILASDIDTKVLAAAERGIYAADRFKHVDPALTRRYFLRRRDGSAFQAKDDLRDMIRFRRINFIDPEWPIRCIFDVILCRNVIIYFNRATQQQLFKRLAHYLNPTGYLMVGHSENLQWLSPLFAPVRNTIYRLKDANAG